MRRPPPRGFTFVEILAVVVLVAVLAALAIPRLSGARDRADTAAAASGLRDLALQQETHRARTGSYARGLAELPELRVSDGVTITITMVDGGRGWAAVARHARLPGRRCGVFYGSASASDAAPAAVAGVVACGDIPQGAPEADEPDEDLPGAEAPRIIQEQGTAGAPPPR